MYFIGILLDSVEILRNDCCLDGLITLLLTRDRAKKRKTDPPIIGYRRQDDRWTAARLLVPGLRIQRDPDDVATPRHVARHLPRLATNRHAVFDFSVKVAALHPA